MREAITNVKSFLIDSDIAQINALCSGCFITVVEKSWHNEPLARDIPELGRLIRNSLGLLWGLIRRGYQGQWTKFVALVIMYELLASSEWITSCVFFINHITHSVSKCLPTHYWDNNLCDSQTWTAWSGCSPTWKQFLSLFRNSHQHYYGK